ncbi:MAG: hypothetical protein ACRDBL_10200 [Rhabdaerophilum sp.]
MSASSTLLLAFFFGASPPTSGDVACDSIRQKERHAYCHCITAQGGKVSDVPPQGRSAFSREPTHQAAIMSCMERRGYGV